MSASNNFVQGSSTKASGSSVPINHLDYSYVKDCTNAKELEEIIKVLRSGSEGSYPDLEEFTEKKLKEINPKSEVLRKDNPAQNLKDLDADAKKAVTEDLLNWMNEANDKDAKLKDSNGPSEETNHVDGLPPVRSKKTILDNTSNENVEKPDSSGSKKTVKPRDYKEWDKLDIDKELENVDKKEESTKPIVGERKNPIKIQPVSTKGLNAEERSLRATREKEKGNEAFRAQDYDEAVVYYTSSLEYEPTAASYNNRAAAELKIEKYSEAIDDCNKVLEFEPNNLKGFLRRGMAYKALKQYDLAVEDFNSMLRIDEGNKRAKELLAEIKASVSANGQSQPEEKSVTPNDDVIPESGSEDTAGANAKKKGQRLKIVEVDNSDDVVGENHVEPLVMGSGNEESSENDLPDQVEETNLETSEGILEGIKGMNDGKTQPQGLSVNSKVNDGALLGDDENIDNNKSNFEGMKDNDLDNGVDCCSATESTVELKNQPVNTLSSQEGDSSSVGGCGREFMDGGVKTMTNSKDEAIDRDVKTDTNCESEALQNDSEMQAAQDEKESAVEIPEEVKSLTREGNDLYKMGHHFEALGKYSECVKHLWEDRELYRRAVSSLLNNKAACYFRMGDCKRCILECNQSLQLVANNVKALLRRGVAFETIEKYAEAFSDFDRARCIDCSNKVAQEHCSRVIKHLEMIHGKSWRKKIFEMNSVDESKHHNLPDVDKTSENPSQVNFEKGYEKTLLQKASLQPDKSLNAGKTGSKNSATGGSQEESGASTKAEFLKLKESGNLLVKKGKHEEAIKQYTECIKLCPEEVAIYTNRALCYLQLMKYDLAESDCNTALRLQPDNIKALFRRGKARKGLGRYREAGDDLIQVLKLDPKNGAAGNELTSVVNLLKKEKKDEEKSALKRKKIIIKDVDGGDDKKPVKAPDKQSNVSTAKKEETPKVAQNDNPKTQELPAKINKTDNSKAKDPSKQSNISAAKKEETLKVAQKDNPKIQELPAKINRTDNSKAKEPTHGVNQKVNTNTTDSCPEVCQKENKKAKNSSQKVSQKNDTKTKEELNTKNTKESRITPVKYNLKSAFQFLQAWKSVKNDTSEYLNILKQLNVADIPKVISNRLDTDMIKSIFEALHHELKTNGDVKFVYQLLHKLTSVERFEMTLMFLSAKETEALRTTFDDLIKQNNKQTGITTKDLSQLRQKYVV